MKSLAIHDTEAIAFALQDEIRNSQEARYHHRLHAILLIVQGVASSEVAALFGDSQRTIQYWVRRFEAEGFAGLMDTGRPGRPKRLGERQLIEISEALRRSPATYGLGGDKWNGKTLSAFIRNKYDVELGIRQCQRLSRQIGLQFRKPRLIKTKVDIDRQRKQTKDHWNRTFD